MAPYKTKEHSHHASMSHHRQQASLVPISKGTVLVSEQPLLHTGCHHIRLVPGRLPSSILEEFHFYPAARVESQKTWAQSRIDVIADDQKGISFRKAHAARLSLVLVQFCHHRVAVDQWHTEVTEGKIHLLKGRQLAMSEHLHQCQAENQRHDDEFWPLVADLQRPPHTFTYQFRWKGVQIVDFDFCRTIYILPVTVLHLSY